jgi:hypothetical protein
MKFKAVATTHWPKLTYLKSRYASIHDDISRDDGGARLEIIAICRVNLQ